MQYWAPLLNSNCKALFLLNYCFGFWLCDSSTVPCRLFITYLPTNRCSFYLPLEDLSYFDPLPKPTLKINETVLQKRWRLNAKHNNMAAAVDAGTKQQSRSWTERELKYFTFVLPDEENDFGYKLDKFALTKTANKTVFEEIKKVFEERMWTEEFKEEHISSFILYWQLKNSSSAFLLQENNFTSSGRAAILNFTAKKIVSCCSSCCSSRLYTRRITWEARYPTGRVTRPRV